MRWPAASALSLWQRKTLFEQHVVDIGCVSGRLSTARYQGETEGGSMSDVSLVVNGRSVSATVEDRTLLVHFLRENLGLTGTHVGCDTSQCGACVVHVDGKAVKSCTMLAAQASGSNILTIEGLAEWRGPASGAGGVQGTSRAAVRFLHARNDHGGDRHDQPPSGRARRGDGARTSSKATSAAAPDITTSSRRYWRLLKRWRRGQRAAAKAA